MNKLMRMSPEIRDSQALVNGLLYLLAFLNNRPVNGFIDREPLLRKEKKNYISILKHEFEGI